MLLSATVLLGLAASLVEGRVEMIHSKRAVETPSSKIDLGSVGITIGSDSYYSPLFTGSELSISEGPYGGNIKSLTPITVFNIEGEATCSGIKKAVKEYLAKDDVFSEEFLEGIYLPLSSSLKASELKCLQKAYGTIYVATGGASVEHLRAFADVAQFKGSLPAGPYILSTTGKTATFGKVYKVFSDEQQAFTAPLVASENGTYFFTPSVQTAGFNTISIPVPSRLYYAEPSADKPLSGKRVAVKDIYDVAGARTGCGNRAYWELYDVKSESAHPVKKLVSLGAVIVGKTKTSQFANGEAATADWVDGLSPFNPRGDGYQDPSSSSSGSGAAEAAYEWLDFAIGSDTGGSVRNPAGVEGLYGIRPSTGAINLTGVMPMAGTLDTAGYFARDAASFATFGKAWYGNHFKEYPSFPKKLIVGSDNWPTTDVAQPVFDAFIDKLASFLKADVVNQTMAGTWTSSGVEASTGANISSYLNYVYPTLIGFYQHKHLTTPFYADYTAKHPGQGRPFVDPVPLVRWKWAREQGQSYYDEQIKRQDIFKDFVNKHLLPHAHGSCSESLLLYPQSSATTQYRNVYGSTPQIPAGWGVYNIANIGAVPEIVVPLGQGVYNSSISGVEDYLPITLSIIAARNCDYMLLSLAEELQRAGLIGGVKTGRYAYDL